MHGIYNFRLLKVLLKIPYIFPLIKEHCRWIFADWSELILSFEGSVVNELRTGN